MAVYRYWGVGEINMPHLTDLSQNTIWQGNNGEKWIVASSITESDKIMVELKKLKVEEELIKE